MIKLGDYNKMTVVKEVDFGIYLDGGDEGEILMPKRYVPEGTKPGDELNVFTTSTRTSDQWQRQRHRCVRWATSPTSKCRG